MIEIRAKCPPSNLLWAPGVQAHRKVRPIRCPSPSLLQRVKVGRVMKQIKISATLLLYAILVTSIGLRSDAVGQTTELGHRLTPIYGNPPAPSLDLRSMEDKHYRLSDYRGSVVLINFWATWCPPCMQELPTLQKLKQKLAGERFEIFAVNLGEDENAIRAFQDKFQISMEFPILLARDESIVEQWKIQGLPMSYIIDPAGRWTYEALGPRDFAHLLVVERIRSLLVK